MSVVVVLEDMRCSLETGLVELLRGSPRTAADVIVVRVGAHPDERDQLEAAYPAARFIFAPSGTPVSRLKAQAMAATEGDIVVFVDGAKPLPRDLIDKLAAAESDLAEAAGAGQAEGDGNEAQRALAAVLRPSTGPRGQKQQDG